MLSGRGGMYAFSPSTQLFGLPSPVRQAPGQPRPHSEAWFQKSTDTLKARVKGPEATCARCAHSSRFPPVPASHLSAERPGAQGNAGGFWGVLDLQAAVGCP